MLISRVIWVNMVEQRVKSVKAKSSLCTPWKHRGSRDSNPLILNLGTRHRWVVSLKLYITCGIIGLWTAKCFDSNEGNNWNSTSYLCFCAATCNENGIQKRQQREDSWKSLLCRGRLIIAFRGCQRASVMSQVSTCLMLQQNIHCSTPSCAPHFVSV